MTAVQEPITWDAEHGVHVVTGYTAASAVLRGAGFSSDPRNNPFTPDELKQVPPSNLLLMDAPEHTRLRRLVAPAFSARAIEALRPRVRAIVTAALDGLEEQADLVPEFGYLVPLAVIAELLDVGADGAGLLHEITPSLTRTLEVDADADDYAAAGHALFEITMFLTPLIAQRRRDPGEDFISALLEQPDITIDEVLTTTVLLLAAGHETTANLIANGVLALTENPDQLPGFLADPARGVEELLRLHGPIKLAGRTAVQAHDLGGYKVDAGQFVLLRLDAANTDPAHVSDPQRLDVTRSGVPNLAFGGGAHYCLGAALARLEAAEALQALFTRFPDLSVTGGEPSWRDSTTFRALNELPVTVGASA